MPIPTPKTAAPAAASEAESHPAEESDGPARSFAINIRLPHIHVLGLDGRISIRGFVKPAGLLAGHGSDKRQARAWR